MNEDRLKGLLVRGKDILYQDFYIRNYTLDEIFSEDFGLDKYYYLISFANIELRDIFKDSKIKIDDRKLYDELYNKPEYRMWLLDVLNSFTYLNWQVGLMNDFIAYDEDKKRHRINEKKFDDFIKILKKVYCINKGKTKSSMAIDPNMAVGKEAKEMAKEFTEFENENKRDKGEGFTLLGIINGLAGKGRGYTYFNIWDLTIYQLMSLFYGINHDEEYGYVMEQINHGMRDLKKNPVNINKIHWAIERLPD